MKIAFVLLDEPKLPPVDAVLSSYRVIALAGPAMLADVSPEEDSAAFRLAGGDSVVVALMPAPIATGEVEATARYSLSSIGKGWSLPEHHAHLVVVLQHDEKRPALELMIEFTRVVAAVASAAEAAAVYLGDAHATHDAGFYIDVASTEEPLPEMLMLWNGVSVAKEGERVSLLSLGMSQLALPDLLLTAPAADANRAFEYLFDLLAYIAHRGEALPEGDTIGGSDEERIEIKYQPSPVDDEAEVWRVDL